MSTTLPTGTTTRTRRIFLLQVAAAGSLAGAAANALAITPVPSGAPTAVNEKDVTAAALGYVSESSRADKKKYPKFSADQKCSTCALYQGKASDGTGNCPIFAGKLVAAGGWCSSWVKKA